MIRVSSSSRLLLSGESLSRHRARLRSSEGVLRSLSLLVVRRHSLVLSRIVLSEVGRLSLRVELVVHWLRLGIGVELVSKLSLSLSLLLLLLSLESSLSLLLLSLGLENSLLSSLLLSLSSGFLFSLSSGSLLGLSLESELFISPGLLFGLLSGSLLLESDLVLSLLLLSGSNHHGVVVVVVTELSHLILELRLVLVLTLVVELVLVSHVSIVLVLVLGVLVLSVLVLRVLVLGELVHGLVLGESQLLWLLVLDLPSVVSIRGIGLNFLLGGNLGLLLGCLFVEFVE